MVAIGSSRAKYSQTQLWRWLILLHRLAPRFEAADTEASGAN
jgi:hypothetical protein